MADRVERIARYEREYVLPGGCKHLHITRLHDRERIDDVIVFAIQSSDSDAVVLVNVVELPEKCVTMTS